MEPKRKNNTNKMGLDVHRGAIKRRAISAINNSPLYFVGRGKHSAPEPSGLSHCNLALGVGILMPFPYSAPSPLILQAPLVHSGAAWAASRPGNTPESGGRRSVIPTQLIIQHVTAILHVKAPPLPSNLSQEYQMGQNGMGSPAFGGVRENKYIYSQSSQGENLCQQEGVFLRERKC